MASLMPVAKQQYFIPGTTIPLIGGKLYTYAAGTSTLKTTYQDAAGTVPNTNPITLDSTGSALIFWDGSYKIVLKDALGNTVYTVDNYNTDPLGVAASFATLLSTAGSDKMGFDFTRPPAANTIGWAAGVNKRGLNVLRYIPPAMWAAIFAGTSTDDHTPYLQTAYNAASNSMEREVYHPAGKYNYTKLYLYYDAALNPTYNVNRNGELTLTGDGISPENGGNCGTVLYTTLTTGDAFNVGSLANDALPYNTRDFIARGISFEGATSGTLVLARGVVSARFEACQFVQSNIAGTALWGTTNYFGVVEKCRFQNRASGTPTGDAIKFGTTIAAGLFTLRDCNISGFANALNMYSGQWQLLNIESSELSGSSYGIYVNGETQILNLSGTYFEGTCTSFIADTASNKIKNLNMFGCWALGSGLSGPALNLNGPNSVQIIGGYSQDQNKTWLNIGGTPSGGNSSYSVHGFSFPRTGAAPAAVTLFTGVIPELHGVDYANTDPNVLLIPAAARPVFSRANFAGSSYTASGHVFGTSMLKTGPVSGGAIDLQAAGYPSFVTSYCVTTPTTLNLPAISAGLPNGYDCTVTSDAASTANLLVKTAVADGAVQIAALVPGQQRLFKFFNDGTTTGWN